MLRVIYIGVDRLVAELAPRASTGGKWTRHDVVLVILLLVHEEGLVAAVAYQPMSGSREPRCAPSTLHRRRERHQLELHEEHILLLRQPDMLHENVVEHW